MYWRKIKLYTHRNRRLTRNAITMTVCQDLLQKNKKNTFSPASRILKWIGYRSRSINTWNSANTAGSVSVVSWSFLARLFEEKSRGNVITWSSASACASACALVKVFVRVIFSKTIKGIHLKLTIVIHHHKRSPYWPGSWPCDLHFRSYLPLFGLRTLK